MHHQIELAYLVLELPEPDILTPVLAEVVGLVPGEPIDGAGTWRDDDRVHRIVVQAGPAGDAVAIGLEAVDDAAFDAVLDRLRHGGFEPEHGGADDLARRRVDRLARVRAPWGIDVELVRGLGVTDKHIKTDQIPNHKNPQLKI